MGGIRPSALFILGLSNASGTEIDPEVSGEVFHAKTQRRQENKEDPNP